MKCMIVLNINHIPSECSFKITIDTCFLKERKRKKKTSWGMLLHKPNGCDLNFWPHIQESHMLVLRYISFY